MKKIFSICLILLLLICGCNNSSTNNNEIKDDVENTDNTVIIDTGDELTIADLNYLYTSYDYINEFYESFYLINDCIEDINDNYYSIYLGLMNDTLEKVNQLTVPLKYLETHKYLVDALKEYIEGTELLFESYKTSDINTYLDASSILTNALSVLDIYFAYIGDDFLAISDFTNALEKNEYYFSAIDVYVYEETFTEEENKALFMLERTIKLLPSTRDELLDNLFREESITGYIRTIQSLKDAVKNVVCSNENIIKYRDDISICLETYVSTLIDFTEIIEGNQFSVETINDYIETLTALNSDIYMSIQGLSDFYKEYSIDIGFTSSLINGSNIE